MRLISCHDGKLLTLDAPGRSTADGKGFATGLDELDALAPAERFARGAVHEVLNEAGTGQAIFFAMVLARAACGITPAPDLSSQQDEEQELKCRVISLFADEEGNGVTGYRSVGVESRLRTPTLPYSDTPSHSSILHPLPRGAIIWCDPTGEIYPPALANFGIPLDRLFLLKTRNDRETVWAIAECLRCKGVAAVVAAPPALSRIEARRLQLAAERGGGAGILLRPLRGRGSAVHAAATRWLVRPMPGERTLQRWSVQLIHGHGGRVGQNVILECSRETHRISVRPAPAVPVRQVAELAHRSPAAKAG